MHIELTQLLTCPRCGPGHGLVAFVDRLEGRRILAGRLDCPQCERRHVVRDGVVDLSGEDGRPDGDGTPPRDTEAAPAVDVPEPAGTATALLGPPDGPETLLLLGAAGALAPAIADERAGAAVVAWSPVVPAAHDRVHPVVPAAGTGKLPFRTSAFDGVVLTGAEIPLLAEAARVLKTGWRLVVLAPGDAVGHGDVASLRELAADPRAWVGVRV